MNFEGVRTHFLSDVFGLLSTSPLDYFPDLDVFSRKINLVPRVLSYPTALGCRKVYFRSLT